MQGNKYKNEHNNNNQENDYQRDANAIILRDRSRGKKTKQNERK